MNMIQFAVCDDEPVMAQEIAERLAEYMRGARIPAYSVRRFSDGRSLLESQHDFDVIFLDVQMDDLNGMETAKALRRQGDRSLLIFVSVLRERVFDAFAVEAFDYLVKPLDRGRFQRTMDRVIRALRQREAKSLAVQRGASLEVIPLAEIVYCEVQGRKIYLHRSDGTVTDYYDKLADLEHRMDGRFFRCHRSYLVNLAHIRGCAAGQVLLPRNERIPVSRSRERDLTQALLRYMKEGVL